MTADMRPTGAVSLSPPDDAYPTSRSEIREGTKVAYDVDPVCCSAAWGWDHSVKTNEMMAWLVSEGYGRGSRPRSALWPRFGQSPALPGHGRQGARSSASGSPALPSGQDGAQDDPEDLSFPHWT
ncbi:uncharacterized protein LOC121829693 [Peromyscus maniculatus bairdii]|uniref:uncharacterized protein LOC121829693 n=1 Tax=Peromyscus maniculatus bairdii TaxID=230844 RepID=UPI003FD3D8A6